MASTSQTTSRKRPKVYDAPTIAEKNARNDLLERDNKRARTGTITAGVKDDGVDKMESSIEAGWGIEIGSGRGSGGEKLVMKSGLRLQAMLGLGEGDGKGKKRVRDETSVSVALSHGANGRTPTLKYPSNAIPNNLVQERASKKPKLIVLSSSGNDPRPSNHKHSKQQEPSSTAGLVPPSTSTNVKGKQKPAKPSPNTQRRILKDHMKEKARWREKYIDAFKREFVFYLDGLDRETEEKVTAGIMALDGKITHFLSTDVTHFIVTAEREKEKAKILHNVDKNRTNGQLFNELDMTGTPRRASKKSTSIPKVQPPVKAVSLHDTAERLGMRIWPLEKLEYVMCNLLSPSNPSIGLSRVLSALSASIPHLLTGALPVSGSSASLPSLLHAEASSGRTLEHDPLASSRDPHWREVHPKNVHFIVEDATGVHKPIIIAEYQKPKKNSKDAPDWPVLHLPVAGVGAARKVMEGRTPFVAESDDEARLKRDDKLARRRRDAVAEERQEQRRKLRGDPAAVVEIEESDEEEKKPTVPAKPTLNQRLAALSTKPRQPVNQQIRRSVSLANLPSRTTTAATASTKLTDMAPPPLPVRRSQEEKDEDDPSIVPPLLLKVGVHTLPGNPHWKVDRDRDGAFLASGNSISMSAIASTTSMMTGGTGTGSAAPAEDMKKVPMDPKIAALKKREVDLGVRAGGMEGKLKRSVSIDAALNARKGGLQKKVLAPRAKEKKKKEGYCENCRGRYEDFDAHVVSTKHKKIANKDSYWKDVDEIISAVQRE
ncbi:hypothetical protein BT69DRAFT_1319960, partial [Atractiella rhizophila]